MRLYYIQYGAEKTNTFGINDGVYSDIWHPTLDVSFPVQMDHMMVNEAYRVWHGAPFLDDALQALTGFTHFDNYRMGPSTQSKYKPLEHIPGLAVGGWFDAGDFDIETNSHINAVASLSDTWNNFKLDWDKTFIDYPTRYPGAAKVKLVQDNLNTHSKGSFYEHLPLQRAGGLSELMDFVFTPKHGSWPNMAEIEFASFVQAVFGQTHSNCSANEATGAKLDTAEK